MSIRPLDSAPAPDAPQASVDPDLEETPRPEELPGGVIHAEFLAEAEMLGGRHWQNATTAERERIATGAAITARRAAAQARRAGYPNIAAFLAATEDREPLPLHPRTGSPAALTWRTLADVPDDPPGELLFGMIEPNGPTLACAAPGVGKGVTGAVMCGEAQQAGMLPVVYDAERRPREWSRRVAGLGGDRSRVIYIEPSDLPRSHVGRPFWDVAPAIGQIAAVAGGDLLIIDSIMPATGVGEDRLRSDAQVPFLWVAAADALGMPSLSFGHPPKGQPEGEPFGSFAWVAAMRLTWLGTKAEGDGHRIRWRPKKRNERGQIPGILLTIDYGDDGRPCAVVRVDDEESTRDWLLASLVHGPRAVADLAEDMLGEVVDPAAGEADRIKERLGRALNRMRHEGWVDRIGGAGRGAKWGLREAR